MITGSLVAIVTPMLEDGTLDLESFKHLIDWHVAEGTDGIVVVGTTGESPTVDFDEHKALIRLAVEHAKGRIPIIADEYVTMEFGSGAVKITPAHDFNDFEVGKRHNLPVINILNKDATLNDSVPEPYRGLDRFEARKRVVADLEAAGLLEKTDPHTLPVPRGDRSGANDPGGTTQDALDEVLVPAFAVVREVGRRKLNMRHFDVQLIGGMVLHSGRIAEMKTNPTMASPISAETISGRR